MKFKVGDKVRILPSAVDIGVDESEVGEVVKIKKIEPDGLRISDSRGQGMICWYVSESDVAHVMKIGEQLLLWDDLWE